MRAVHKVQDLAFHLKTAEKNKSVCLKKEEEVENLKRQLSFWQHMNAVQNEKITQQLETISKGRDELAGLNEQIFEMQERLVKIRVKFGVGNKEHKAPSSGNNMTRIGRISASAEPTFKSFCEGHGENHGSFSNVKSNPIKRGTNYSENLLLENTEENNEINKITTKRCWQQIPTIKSLESQHVLQNTFLNEEKDVTETSKFNHAVKLSSEKDLNIISIPEIDILNLTDDSFSDCNDEKCTAKGVKTCNRLTKPLINGSQQNKLKNNDRSYDEEDSFIKLLSEDDDPVNTDTDSDVRTHPVESEELDMITNVPPVIINSSRSADIRKSRSLSPANENDTCDIGNVTNQKLASGDKKNGCDIKINIQGENGELISEAYDSEDALLPILSNDKKGGSNATKRVSFEHSAMLRSACVEGNLDLVKSLYFSAGRDIEGNAFRFSLILVVISNRTSIQNIHDYIY